MSQGLLHNSSLQYRLQYKGTLRAGVSMQQVHLSNQICNLDIRELSNELVDTVHPMLYQVFHYVEQIWLQNKDIQQHINYLESLRLI